MAKNYFGHRGAGHKSAFLSHVAALTRTHTVRSISCFHGVIATAATWWSAAVIAALPRSSRPRRRGKHYGSRQPRSQCGSRQAVVTFSRTRQLPRRHLEQGWDPTSDHHR